MLMRQSIMQPFSFKVIRDFFPPSEESFEELQPITNREFFSVLGMLVVGLLLLAVTIGPITIL